MDMLPLVVAVQLYLLLAGGLRKAGRPSWLLGLALFCGVSLAYGLFRWFYFHDLLPNTYYLKLSGVPLTIRLLRGLSVFIVFLRDHLTLLLPAGLGAAVLVRRNRRLVLPAAVFAIYCAYSVFVGGDAWDGDINVRANRFIAFVMPLLFVLFNGVLNEALGVWRRDAVDSTGQRFVVAAATAAALLLVNGLWLSGRADENWRNLAVTDWPPGVERHRRQANRLVSFERLVRPGAVVATAWGGIPAYFTDYRMVDILGYSDRTVARMPPVVEIDEDRYSAFRPGHVKWDEARLLHDQRPDAFFQLWGQRRMARLLPEAGYRQIGGFWVRSDSAYVVQPREPGQYGTISTRKSKKRQP
jgi:hypothetical protein